MPWHRFPSLMWLLKFSGAMFPSFLLEFFCIPGRLDLYFFFFLFTCRLFLYLFPFGLAFYLVVSLKWTFLGSWRVCPCHVQYKASPVQYKGMALHCLVRFRHYDAVSPCRYVSTGLVRISQRRITSNKRCAGCRGVGTRWRNRFRTALLLRGNILLSSNLCALRGLRL